MAKTSFRATVSPKMGSFQMNFSALGITYGKEIRADPKTSASDVNVVARSMAVNKKCVLIWYPPDYREYATVFKVAKEEKLIIELFDLYLQVEGYPPERVHCTGTRVKNVFKHNSGEEAVELEMQKVVAK